ncbi:MAG TPA: cobalt ECF transporter T component CbiQ [Methanospirillum sp.]|nr:cobalt ECF transporter T component CbiQ [Methanospirillum sp.]
MIGHDFLEETAHHNALLQVHPFTKLFLGVGSIILVLLTPNYIVPCFLAMTLSIIIIVLAKINLKFYLKLLGIPLSFAMLSALVIIFLSEGVTEIWSVQLFPWLTLAATSESLNQGLHIFSRIFGGMCALFFISLTTPMTDLFGIMKKLKIPELFIDLSMIIYRYIFIFMEKASQIYLAQKMRLGYTRPGEAVRSYSMLFGSIFITSWDAGEDLINAMDGRCYNGKHAKITSYNPVEWRTLSAVMIYLFIITGMILWTSG